VNSNSSDNQGLCAEATGLWGWIFFNFHLFLNYEFFSNPHHYLQLLQMIAVMHLIKFPELGGVFLPPPFLHTYESATLMLPISLLLPHYYKCKTHENTRGCTCLTCTIQQPCTNSKGPSLTFKFNANVLMKILVNSKIDSGWRQT